jgi:hypothetical protein
MIDYQFLLVASIAPVGALLIGLWLAYESYQRRRHDRQDGGKHAAE